MISVLIPANFSRAALNARISVGQTTGGGSRVKSGRKRFEEVWKCDAVRCGEARSAAFFGGRGATHR